MNSRFVVRARGLFLSERGIDPAAWALATFALALVARVVFVVCQLELHLFNVNFNSPDSGLYRELANALRAGHYAIGGQPTAYRTPGYPAFLAVVFELSRSTVFIALIQSVIGAATCVLLGGVARRLGGLRAAWATGIISALCPDLVIWTGYVLVEVLYVFGIALALLALARVLEGPRFGRGLLAGACAGATTLVRPIILGFALILTLYGVARAPWRRAALAALVGISVMVGPWIVRNEVSLHNSVIGTTEAGFVLYQGNSPGADGGSRGYLDDRDFKALTFPPQTTEVSKNRTYLHRALRWMLEHPGRVIALIPTKLWNMWRPTYAGASLLNTIVTYATYPLLLLLSVAGLVIARRRGPLGLALIALVGYHLAFHGITTGTIRYRVPVVAVLTVLAGVAVAEFSGRVTEPRHRSSPRVLRPGLS